MRVPGRQPPSALILGQVNGVPPQPPHPGKPARPRAPPIAAPRAQRWHRKGRPCQPGGVGVRWGAGSVQDVLAARRVTPCTPSEVGAVPAAAMARCWPGVFFAPSFPN